MVVVVLEWAKARMFTKENYINANDRLMAGMGRSNECFDRRHEFRIQR
jgi:hypothetical protein